MSSKIEVKRLCQHCGREFNARTTVTRYCSHACASQAYKLRIRQQKAAVSHEETAYRTMESKKELYDKPILSVREAAQVLSLSPKAIHALIREGKLLASNLSERMTRIVKSSVIELLEYTRIDLKQPRVTKSVNNLPVTIESNTLSQGNGYSIPELIALFDMDRQSLYTLLSRKKIPKIKVKKCRYYDRAAIDKLIRDRALPQETALDLMRKAHQKQVQPLHVEECYAIAELEEMFGKERTLLYPFLRRRGVPTLKVGTQVFHSKKAIKKIIKDYRAA